MASFIIEIMELFWSVATIVSVPFGLLMPLEAAELAWGETQTIQTGD